MKYGYKYTIIKLLILFKRYSLAFSVTSSIRYTLGKAALDA